MRQILKLLLILPLLAQCQAKENLDSDNWKKFLEKFPTQSFDALKWVPSIKNVKDTIAPNLINKMLWQERRKPETIYKGEKFQYPIAAKFRTEKKYRWYSKNKKGEKCRVPLIVYPFFKIKLKNGKTLISYLHFEIGEQIIFQPLILLDENYDKIGYFAFIYSHKWRYCDSTLEEILEETKPYSAPIELYENGFLLHDQMVGSYYENTLNDQYWKVIIRDDGKFEIVEEKKNYEDGMVTLWSKYGYHVSDPDGYTNLRESPSTSSEILSQVKNDTTLEILDASSDWWKVRTPDGNEGYMHSSRIVKGDEE